MGGAARILLVLVLVSVLLPALAGACPLCKDAKSDTDYAGGTASLPKGFYYSILLMVSAPFAVVGGLALRIVSARRRAALAAAPAPAGPTPAPASPSRLVPDSRGAPS
jgi:hypothetical protein